MSYSFGIKANDKAAAKAAVAAEFDKVVQQQPIHARDRDAALAAAGAFIDLLAEDETKQINVTVYGTLGWAGNEGSLTSGSVSASAYLLAREG